LVTKSAISNVKDRSWVLTCTPAKSFVNDNKTVMIWYESIAYLSRFSPILLTFCACGA
jgi:hypothetical protein